MSGRNRYQAGAVVAGEKTGGQFKAAERTQACGSVLSGMCPTHGSEPMFRSARTARQMGTSCTCPVAQERLITTEPVMMKWVERGVSPKSWWRRKKRNVTHTVPVSAAFRELRTEDTGEAFTLAPAGRPPKEYRHFDGRLFTPVLASDLYGSAADGDRFEHLDAAQNHLGHITYPHGSSGVAFPSEEKLTGFAQSMADQHLVIDGKLWRQAEEPVYQVFRYGDDEGFGETTLNILESHEHSPFDSQGTFTLEEFEDAHALAIKVAREQRHAGSEKQLLSMENPVPSLSPTRPWAHNTKPNRKAG